MSILGSIFSKILGHHGAAAAPAPAAPAAATVASSAPAQSPNPAIGTSGSPASDVTPTPPIPAGPSATTPPASPPPAASATADAGGASTAASSAAAPTASAQASPVDVAAILNGLAAKNSQTLDWRHSIVDMMKLLDLDSSLSARQALAGELHYPGDKNDTATMNVWLHKQVMAKLAENGGKVPADLKV